jgi:hypothetical protein
MQSTITGPAVPHAAVLAAAARHARATRRAAPPEPPRLPPDLDPHPGQLSLLDLPGAVDPA